jgi:bifunctional non-homologous end joining protein LigD
LHERRKQLSALLDDAEEPIRYSAEIRGDPKRLLEEVRQRGLEGIIGKERDSRYEPGRRSRSWIKLKCVSEQEMVIGGHTPPEGTRKHFGALLVGYYERERLRFAGKVGTGFDAALLKSLHGKMNALNRTSCPFANLPEKQQGRWSQNITPREMKLCHWVEPQLVCQVRFTEWTRDGKLRHPVFLGLREDKDAREVVRERAA